MIVVFKELKKLSKNCRGYEDLALKKIEEVD
jgi:hypothetical protein